MITKRVSKWDSNPNNRLSSKNKKTRLSACHICYQKNGAIKQNLLKLFAWIVDDPAFGAPILPEPRPCDEIIIY